MDEAYDPQAVETKWQARWAAEGAYQVDNDDSRPTSYVLCMYPYPSGPAHMGHVRNYTFGDLTVRHRTMHGQAVLSPIGFDSFGLPAENAAIKTGAHPRSFTDARIEELKASLVRLGASYDWRREIRSHAASVRKSGRNPRPHRPRGVGVAVPADGRGRKNKEELQIRCPRWSTTASSTGHGGLAEGFAIRSGQTSEPPTMAGAYRRGTPGST
ncbi:MAG: class I tRNA ligase family protein [Pseudonocardiaceae bacterium]